MWHYRIRHVLLITSLIGFVLGPIVSLEHSVRREEAAVATIIAFGGKTMTRDIWPHWLPRRYRSAVVRVELGAPRSLLVGGDPFMIDNSSPENSIRLPEAMAALDAFPRLSELHFSTQINGSDLSRIRRPNRIIELGIASAKLGHNVDVFRRFRNLRSLSLAYSDFDDSGMRIIADLGHLESLNLSKTRITNQGLTVLNQLRDLSVLDLSETRITNDGLTFLAHCKNLKSVNLSQTPITDEGLKSLGTLSRLQSLNIATTGVVGPGLHSLVNLSNLSQINMARPPRPARVNVGFDDTLRRFWQEGEYGAQLPAYASQQLRLATIPTFASLTSLNLANSLLDEASIGAIARQPNLAKLDLSGSNIEDEWLCLLAGMKLRWLSISDTTVSGAGLSMVAKISTLIGLSAERINVPAEQISVLAQLKSLETLTLDRIKGTSGLMPTIKSLHQLKCLTLTNCELVDSNVNALMTLPALEFLNVEGNPVTGSTIIVR